MNDVQRIYEDTVHALIYYPATLPPLHLWYNPPFELSLIFANDNTYYYYLGTDKYEIPKYL